MKVALIIWQLDMYGGSIRQCLELARYLKKSGHTAEVFAYQVNRKRCFPEFIDEITIHTPEQLPIKQWLYNPTDALPVRMIAFLYNALLQKLQVAALEKELLRRHREIDFNVFNFHDNGVIQIAQRLPKERTVWMLNDPPSFIDTLEKDASIYARTRLVRLFADWQAHATRALLHHVGKIIVLDERNKKIVVRHFHTKASIVRSGLAIHPQLQKLIDKGRKNKVRILTTNIFFRHRRYEDLVKAANILVHHKKIRNIEFHIIGDTSSDVGYFHEIEGLAQSLGLEHYFKFLGKVNEEVLEREYREADIFVFANHNQTWGLSVFEAMLRGCAVILSKTSGAHDVLSDGINALFIEPKNPQDLAKKLEALIHSSSLRKKIAKNGHSFVLKNISWEKYCKDMVREFSS